METHTSTLFVVLTTPFFDKEISWLGIFQSLKRVCISNYLQATEVPTSQLKLCFSKADQRPWSSRQRIGMSILCTVRKSQPKEEKKRPSIKAKKSWQETRKATRKEGRQGIKKEMGKKERYIQNVSVNHSEAPKDCKPTRGETLQTPPRAPAPGLHCVVLRRASGVGPVAVAPPTDRPP